MARWLVAFLSVVGIVTADYEPNWASLDARPLPSWYDEAKFGIFLHWGVYSVPSFGTEWFWDRWQGKKEKEFVDFMTENYPPGFSYPEFAPMFHAELFDPVAWAKLFSEAGAKYVVLTSKHHEGFTNWPSKYSWNWNSMDTGPHRDLVGDLAAAIRNNTDIHFGLYYSLFEWFHPLYLKDKDVMLPQLYEIVNGYHPEVIWSDGDWGANDTYWNSTEFLAWLYNESPVKDTVVVNDRWGSGDHCTHGGYFTCHDRFNPGKLYNHKYENAMTVQRTSWGYIRNTNISGYLSIEELLNQLVGTVSTGGNMLMNVGPNHDGRIMPIFEERLLQMGYHVYQDRWLPLQDEILASQCDTGSWLKINGEAIYGSKPWKHQNDSINKDAWYTVDSTGKVVYAIFLTWPDNFILQLGDVMATNQTMATLLGYTGSIKISWQDGSEGINATLPYLPPNTPLQWAWTLKLESAMARPPLDNWNRKQQNVLK